MKGKGYKKDRFMTPQKKALITELSGDYKSYPAKLLLLKGCEVHGCIHQASVFNISRIDHISVDPHEAGTRFFRYSGDLVQSMTGSGHLAAGHEVIGEGISGCIKKFSEITVEWELTCPGNEL